MFANIKRIEQAMWDIQRIKMSNDTTKLSLSEVVFLICNTPDASKNLTPEEFKQYMKVFKSFRRKKRHRLVDKYGYLEMCFEIIDEIERYFPYMLVDGSHSEDMSLLDQKKVRELHAKGIKYKDALTQFDGSTASMAL